MDRVIKDYMPSNHGITKKFLYESNDWDIIELNYSIDINALQDWFKTLETDFSYLKYDFNKMHNLLNLELSKQMVEQGYCGYYCGPIYGYTLAWPIERYEPLPPPVQANLDLFPEVNLDTFNTDAKILSKVRFGYFDYLVNDLGEDVFRQLVVTNHLPKMYIRQHIDSKVLKLHIPIFTDENAVFHFGKNKERNYHMKAGKAYILNPGDWHGTENNSNVTRSHIITRIAEEKVLELIEKTNA